MVKSFFLATLLAPSVALAWSGAAAAQAPAASPTTSAAPAPSAARTPGGTAEAEGTAAAPSTPPPFRAGVIGGIGFPRPLAIEGLAEISGYLALGIEYGTLPTLTVDGVSAGLWSVAGDLRLFPFRGPFFLGLRAGRQHISATTTVAMGAFGDATEVLALDSWFLNPRVGFLWTMRGGLTFGVEAGVQFPLSPSVSSSLPLALYPSAQRTIDALGSSVIPTVDLLRVGLVL
jgi:hypothetical protein